MGYRIEFRTEHDDNGAAIQALAGNVGDSQLTLLSTDDVPEGSWVAFEILLEDGSVFLEGMGRCESSTSSNGGFDVVMGTLQLDTTAELLFERMVLARDDVAAGGRLTGEVDISKLPTPKTGGSSVPPPSIGVTIERPSDAPKAWKPPRPAVPKPATAAKAAKPAPKAPPALPTARVSTDPPLPPRLRQRLMNLVPTLVAEGRVRDLAQTRDLALTIGIQALETFLEDE